MPYLIQSHCAECEQGDEFTIGDWTRHYGVYVCSSCQKLVNIPVEDGKCPGCGQQPTLAEYYDYSFAIPYLGGQTPRPLDAGPTCPKCKKTHLVFHNTAHLNMGAVVFNEAAAKTTWGMDYMEKAIFMNSAVPVIQEFQVDAAKVFSYFHLHIPTAPLITRRLSYPIILDIRTHLMLRVRMEPQRFHRENLQ